MASPGVLPHKSALHISPAEPSRADELLTSSLKDALALVDAKVLDPGSPDLAPCRCRMRCAVAGETDRGRSVQASDFRASAPCGHSRLR